MDRAIRKKKITIKRIILLSLILLTIGILIASAKRGFDPSYRIRDREIIISEVREHSLAETIQVVGKIEPKNNFYMEIREQGFVKDLIESGSRVKPGDVLVELTNKQLELELQGAEESLNVLLNEFNLFIEESQLRDIEYREELLNLNYTIDSLKNSFEINSELYTSGGISKEKLKRSRDEYNYYLDKKDILNDRVAKLVSIDNLKKESYKIREDSLKREIDKVQNRIDSLIIRANIEGVFSYDELYIGQSLYSGNILGVISSEEEFIIRSYIDEFYLKELTIGDRAKFRVKSGSFTGEATLKKISSEIEDSSIIVEFEINSSTELKPGQSLNIKIFTGNTKKRLVIDNGAFYKNTLGNWIFKVEGDIADRVDIKTGFKDREYIEIISGLDIGDKVVISGYERFKEYKKLKIEELK